jgi:catechol 2,3-dioxygenase-like lactoylglutathione lyase family enzyme
MIRWLQIERTIPKKIAVLFLLVLASSRAIGLAAASEQALVQEVRGVGFTVSDLDRAVAFYTNVLTFEKVSETEVWGEEQERLQGVFGVRMRVARMRLGNEFLELTEYLSPRGRPIPADSRSNDRWFQHIAIIVSDMDQAYERLRAHKVTHASSGPQRLPDWNKNAAGIEGFYFKDPDGHTLEVLAFPPDKGDPKWHRKSNRLFFGIDHTAIVVGDTDTSLGFYRDLLGFRVAGESENYGIEQEHLNNVFGARLRITSLRVEAGPAIELLEYLAPRDGRAFPPDTRANDLVHWQTELRTRAINQADKKIRAERIRYVSPGIVTLPDGKRGFGEGLMVRDPDGHAMLLTEE